MGQSVIEINGTRYDATTGKIVVAPVTNATASSGHNIDGVVNATKQSASLAPKPTPKLQVLTPRSKEDIAKQRRVHDVSMVHGGRVNKSKTLMRSSVKKPHHKQPTASPTHPSSVAHSSSYSAAAHSDVRLHKALSTPTNSNVARFATPTIHDSSVKPTVVANLPVREQTITHPVAVPALPKAQAIESTSPATRFVDSQLSKVATDQQDTHIKKKPIHKRIVSKVKHHKFKSIAASGLAALLIVGFIAYQNLPTITLAMANKEAGISAKMPEGIPSNFSLDRNINRSPGLVVMTYSSRVDDRKFTLTQVKADTTVQTLKDTVARATNNQFQTYEAGGITLFLGANDRVDWMDGGMRYNITGTTGFSPDQIAMIASSL